VEISKDVVNEQDVSTILVSMTFSNGIQDKSERMI
jgi:hypothetical protein